MTPPRDEDQPTRDLSAELPDGWTASTPGPDDAAELTALLRRHEAFGRGWAGASEEDLLIDISPQDDLTRENVVLRGPEGTIIGWSSAHDRAAGRMLLVTVVDRRLDDETADRVAAWLFSWAERVAEVVGRRRGLDVQQIDSGAFAEDDRQHRWLERAGFTQVRTWWQMTRPVEPGEADLDAEAKPGVRIRPVERQGTGMPDEDDLRTVHEILESAFADHFNSHAETFDEFVSRLREDPGHRWDHWWIAELVDDDGPPEPAGALVGAVSPGAGDAPAGSYVEYIGVLQNARGRGVAKSLLNTVVADAASRGRDRVGLEVDADSPTGADGLYVSMGWTTKYVTESWHRDVPVQPVPGR
ncbi:GNAT family N-acetyltransferase [Nocardioides panacis]|uniref:GNAT family N-acetyltransferase n=1 Tax=Nocardioides panacis TaxID=2849501 RepID=A0A975SWJ5_9ACTN|nr:N-acetyltransferase [Nocardioides panacis]QWZ07240.1 GNAT family N-acetyltransferase [Nocardioides panacis]